MSASVLGMLLISFKEKFTLGIQCKFIQFAVCSFTNKMDPKDFLFIFYSNANVSDGKHKRDVSLFCKGQ